MALDDFMAKLPEADRELFKAELGNYVPKAELEKYVPADSLEKHPMFQSKLSLKHEESMKKFQTEKLPSLIEEEIKKRGTKQPWEIEIEKLKQEAVEKDRLLTLKERKSEAIAELSKHGLDPSLADYVLEVEEEKFKEKLNNLTGKLSSWRDDAINTELKKSFGQASPKRGDDPTAKTLPREQFNALPHDQQRAFVASGGRPI
jgi:hypothetical protein